MSEYKADWWLLGTYAVWGRQVSSGGLRVQGCTEEVHRTVRHFTLLNTTRGYMLLPHVPCKAIEWFWARNCPPHWPTGVCSCPSLDSMYPLFFPVQELNQICPCASAWKDVYFLSRVVKPWKGRLDIQDPGSNPEGDLLKLMQLWFHFDWLCEEKGSSNSEEYQAKVTVLSLYNTGSVRYWFC